MQVTKFPPKNGLALQKQTLAAFDHDHYLWKKFGGVSVTKKNVSVNGGSSKKSDKTLQKFIQVFSTLAVNGPELFY
jgi:hypothetical protein